MQLMVPILLNMVLVLVVYLADTRTPLRSMSYKTKQICIGVLFGGVSAFASGYGVEWFGTIVNVRDAAPLSAGLIFGAPAGILSGVIGGLYRWLSVYWGGGVYSQLACSIATVLAGLMAAGLRKLMFDNKKPTWGYGVCVAVVCEVIHMILIFLTNMNDSAYAFEFVKGATLPMILGNAAAVGAAIILVSLLGREGVAHSKGRRRISDTFQRWLLVCIVAAYAITGLFTFVLQNGMERIETQDVFTVAMNDVQADIRGKSDSNILHIAQMVKQDYERDTHVSLHVLADTYGVKEINVVDENGIIRNSTESDVIGTYDMNSKAQSKAFVDTLKTQDSYVQEYGPRGKEESVWRKYAAVCLTDGGFIQVGYDVEQFHRMLNEFVVDVTKNRHVGTGGFVAVCDDQLNMVIDNEYAGLPISAIGIEPPAEMKNGQAATSLYYADVADGKSTASVRYMYVFQFVEGYCIIAAIPESEAMFMRDASLYTGIFMQVLIFAALFVFIYILIKRVILNNLKQVNDTLGRITKGNLEVRVDVRSSEEFSSLSDDINSTVATLKRYIAEEAARIDKELEYAKQIQQSALPVDFPRDADYRLYAQMIAAREVGGDFYDFYKLNDTTVVFLAADVSGKGIPAALFMMTAKTVLKSLAERGLSVDEIFTKANETLCENNESGMFVTAWMGILDLTTGVLRFANAGHNPPLLKRADGSFEYLKARTGFVLAGMEGVCYRQQEITLQAGDRLFLYTDGVTEATNADHELYGEERLRAVMNRNRFIDAERLLAVIKADMDAFVGEAPQFDDITMLVLDYKPQKGGATMTKQTFPAKTEALLDVLGFVDRMLESFGISMKVQTAVCVAVEEVFVNIARYAYEGKEGTVTLGIGYDPIGHKLTLQWTDQGAPFDPLKVPEPDITLSAEDRPVGGLGILIVKRTMTTLQYVYENGMNQLTMTKDMEKEDLNHDD